MKAKCIKLLDIRGNPQSRSPWLTVGRIYHVLSVVLDVDGRWLFRINGDSEPGVGLFPFQQFEIVSPKVPNIWIVTWRTEGVFSLTTQDWSEPRFWERYFEGDEDARSIFARDVRRIVEADP
jgi:hypothetical protein